MKINLEECLEKKEIRTLKNEWPMFCNKKRYFKPKNIQEIKELYEADRFPTEIKIDGITHYFTSEIRQNFWNFVKKIHHHPLISENISYNSVYKIVFSELEKSINSEQKNIPLETISYELSNKLATYEFYFLVRGIKFKDFNYLQLGDAFIFTFDEFNLNKIIENRFPASKDDDFENPTSEFLGKNFLGETCIKVSSFGDKEKSEDKARHKCRLVLNYFRFLFCICFYERIHENKIKISIKSEMFNENEAYFCQSEINGEVSLVSGIGRRNLQDFELDTLFLKDNRLVLTINNSQLAK